MRLPARSYRYYLKLKKKQSWQVSGFYRQGQKQYINIQSLRVAIGFLQFLRSPSFFERSYKLDIFTRTSHHTLTMVLQARIMYTCINNNFINLLTSIHFLYAHNRYIIRIIRWVRGTLTNRENVINGMTTDNDNSSKQLVTHLEWSRNSDAVAIERSNPSIHAIAHFLPGFQLKILLLRSPRYSMFGAG